MSRSDFDASTVTSFQRDFDALEAALASAIAGQAELIHELLVALFADGHVLLEGLPGLGKTHLVKALACATGEALARVQCTPDLMPADITGSEIPDTREGSMTGELRFRPGPVFSPLLLVDEINRATPRTQSALLEAMQERQVTCAGRSYPLPSPFSVIATQNPIEIEGTYPLPEAQLDRFFFKCNVEYPDRTTLLQIADLSLDSEPSDHLPVVLTTDRRIEMSKQAREVVIASALKERAAALVMATQPEAPSARGSAREHLRFGASPRALQTLLRAARVHALAAGRAHVSGEDLRRMALPALRHRILLRVESEVRGVTADAVLAEILSEWEAEA